MNTELKLREFGGQRCDATICRRDDGSVYVRFETSPGYGGPYLELATLKQLVDLAESLTQYKLAKGPHREPRDAGIGKVGGPTDGCRRRPR